MIGEPRLDRGNLAVGQERHDPPSLQIADDRAVAMIPAPGPIIDADHIQRSVRRARSSPHNPQQGVVTDGRRAKTDRLDAEGMLRVLAVYLRGDLQACSMVRVPTPEEEDAERTHREREKLVQERLRIENRIDALLFTQGIRKRPSLRSWERDLAVLRTGDGREIPRHLRAELDRLRRRLVMTLELIREVEAERDLAAETKPQDQACRKIAALCRIRGIGENFAAVLTREVFYRSFDNRRQIASYVGITPMP